MEERWTRVEEGRKKKEGRLGRRKSGGIRFGLEAEERDAGYPGDKKSVLESVSAGRGGFWSRSWMKSYGETRDEGVDTIDRSCTP